MHAKRDKYKPAKQDSSKWWRSGYTKFDLFPRKTAADLRDAKERAKEELRARKADKEFPRKSKQKPN